MGGAKFKKMFIFSGRTSQHPPPPNSMRKFDPTSETWGIPNFLLTCRFEHSAREATISTYSDRAKSMAKVRTEILNSIDSMSSFRQPLDLGKDGTNPRKRAKDQIDTEGIKKVSMKA
ncbi:hypothetical protein G9A89_009354 [Geosiphon pyriformis]|nr:hypothetical protein G9A89_009354 [Geosiphon pyriformis]